MARLSAIIKNNKRKKLAHKNFEKRNEYRKIIKSTTLGADEKILAQIKLQDLPRNSSFTRVRNRCSLTGKPRACYRKFGLSRMKFRELALRGMIPGITKASW